MAIHNVTSLFVLLLIIATSAKKKSYRAATVEYEPYFKKNMKPVDLLIANAEKQAEYVTKAAEQKSDIIVFPEYGIVTLEGDDNVEFTREEALQYFQTVPNPKNISWNPCLNPNDYQQTEVLHILSCSARNNSIAILTNLLSKDDCNNQTDPNCPKDGRYLHNTNVVFDKNGTLIARYHKHHLYGEILLNSPNQTEHIIFNIDGIDFASFICFDISYKNPAVEYVKSFGVKNIIFSTAWVSGLPFSLGPQIYSRWARGLGANLIVTNYFKPQISRIASGIYSSQLGALAETFDVSKAKDLLIADLPIDPSPVPTETTCLQQVTAMESTPNTNTNESYVKYIMTDKPTSKPVEPIHKIYYEPLIDYTALYLKESQGNVNVCQNNVCCNLVYNVSLNNDSGVYALLVFDGIQKLDLFFMKFGYRMQICSLMRCEKENQIETCGRVPITNATAEFNQLLLTTQMEDDVIFPSILQTDLQILPAVDWNYSLTKCGEKSQGKIELNAKQKSILVTSMTARLYNEDYKVITLNDK